MLKTVLITGASRGIGHATALFFQKKGWQVAATMRAPKKATTLAALDRVMCLGLDVLNPTSIDSALTATLDKFGRIDALINNAGYAAFGPLEAATTEQVRRQYDVNLFGLIQVTQKVLPIFRKQKEGVIVNISSIGGRMTFPWYSFYNSTKWAVEGLSEAVLHELKPYNIRVKLVEPGLIKTDFYTDSMDRIHNPECTVYDEAFEHYAKNMEQGLKMAGTPEQVANVIYKATLDRSRKLRYPAAGGAHLLLFLHKILPDALYLPLMSIMTKQ
jgi:NAD(P)-dependent dehydrogenase (short-subunit alcohol dehydrogenase family)